jgi:hypothetical protein
LVASALLKEERIALVLQCTFKFVRLKTRMKSVHISNSSHICSQREPQLARWGQVPEPRLVQLGILTTRNGPRQDFGSGYREKIECIVV